MELRKFIIPTRIATKSTTVREVFSECVNKQLPALPFCDEQGKVIGRVSLRYLMYRLYIPEDVRKYAHLLGDEVSPLEIPRVKLHSILEHSVANLVIPNIPTVSSTCPLIKALALIEEFSTSYIFVVDNEQYQGIVTLLEIARSALEQNAHT